MNRIDARLQALLQAAAAAPSQLPAEAPFWMEAQVLAALRAETASDPGVRLVPLYRAALVCACAIILISSVLSFRTFNEAPPSEWVIVDAAIQSTFMQ